MINEMQESLMKKEKTIQEQQIKIVDLERDQKSLSNSLSSLKYWLIANGTYFVYIALKNGLQYAFH